MKKATDEQLLESYFRLGNIWKVAPEFNMCGQSVWERLKKLGIEDKDRWTNEQLRILIEGYSQNLTGPINLDLVAQSTGKLKSNVARKARELGLTNQHRTKTLEAKAAMNEGLRRYIRDNGHPRESRESRVCPICGRFYFVRKRSKQKYCSVRCQIMAKKPEERFTNRKGGRRKDIGDIYFRSSYEANYARYLNFIISNGSNIEKWEFESQRFEFNKIKTGTRSYTPDFKIYYKDGHIEYHEVKGWDYPKGKTQRKRFAKYYPHLKLVLVDDNFFKAIKKQGINKLIPYWE